MLRPRERNGSMISRIVRPATSAPTRNVINNFADGNEHSATFNLHSRGLRPKCDATSGFRERSNYYASVRGFKQNNFT